MSYKCARNEQAQEHMQGVFFLKKIKSNNN